MNYFLLTAELRSPLMIQENRQSNAPRGLHYLPGSTLRGAIAGHLLRRGGSHEDVDFQSLFLNEPVFFPDLLPVDVSGTEARPLPKTAFSCKQSPGFKSEGGHGVSDILSIKAAERIIGGPVAEALTCPSCGEDLKPFQGFWNADVKGPAAFESEVVYQRHTGIDRLTGTVAEEIFYITQGMADFRLAEDGTEYPQYLAAGVRLTQEQEKALRYAITDPIFTGADRTRGMGEIILSINPANEPVLDLEGWNHAFRKRLLLPPGNKEPESCFFSIGLTSHAILVDRFLRASSDLQLDFPGIESVASIVRAKTIRGWQSSWRLPKPDDLALAMGSVFLFRYTGDDMPGLAGFLKDLAVSGIGLRRPEGFGRIHICDSIHIQEVI